MLVETCGRRGGSRVSNPLVVGARWGQNGEQCALDLDKYWLEMVEAAGIEPAPTEPPVSPEPLEDKDPSDGPS